MGSQTLARLRHLLLAAAENVVRDGLGYAVAAAALVLPLTLLLCGVAISEGVKQEALASVRGGANLYCTWDMFGRDAPVPAEKIAALARLEGVVEVVPRIVGRLPVGDLMALVVALPIERLRDASLPLRGAPPRSGADVLVGCALADQLGLAPGMKIGLDGDLLRLFTVSGIVDGDAPLASAKAVLCDLAEAGEVFGELDHVSDVCLFTRAGYEEAVATAVRRLDSRFRVQTRDLVAGYVERGMTLREGSFTLLFALAMALALAAFAILSHRGGSARRLEVALRKAQGWTTADVLTMVAFENFVVSLLAAGLSLLLAQLWLRLLNAPLIAPFFLPDLPLFPTIHVPARFTPLPALLAIVFSLVVTMSGSIFATWRTAITSPAEVLR